MDVVTYALLKKKITSALSGIADISLDGNQTIVFKTNDGTDFKIKIPTPDLIYVGPEAPPEDSDYELWIDTDDEGTSGFGNAVLSEEIVASTVIGSVKAGHVYPAGTRLEDIIRDILTSYTKPTVTVTTAPETEIYDIVEDSLSDITIKAKVVKGTNDITSITFYIDNVQLAVKEGEEVAKGGNFEVPKHFDTPVKKTFVCKVSADDGKSITNGTKTIIFIGKSYYGTVEGEDFEVTEDIIKNLQFKTLKNSRALIYSDIKVDYGKILYAYPKELGKITKVVDDNGFETTSSYDIKEIKVDDLDYYYVILKDAMGTDGAYQKFS